MSSDGSVTHWLQLLQTGEDLAAQEIWERYFQRLVGLARAKLQLRGANRRTRDEEDVALSVFDTFCRGLEEGRFPRMQDRDDLWKVLVVLTAQKSIRTVQHERRLKRGGGRVVTEADLGHADDDFTLLDQFVGNEPSPAFAVQVAEQCKLLLDRLGEGDLRSIAHWKLEGHTNGQIAAMLGCLERTVERKLRVIRGLWETPCD